MSLKTPTPEENPINIAVPVGFDPQAVPVQGYCVGQPQIQQSMLSGEGLRSRFLSPPPWEPEITDENRHVIASNIIAKRQSEGKVVKAAVLIPLLQKKEGLAVLLTQQASHLRDHAGQISFPGGRMDPEDGGPEDTALRESFEEIGLESNRVELIGSLPEYLTVSGYRVNPIVGLVQPQAAYVLDEFEVADVFEVPLGFLMNPANHQIRVYDSDQGARRFYAMPYEGRFIWGATAGMLRNLYHLLKA